METKKYIPENYAAQIGDVLYSSEHVKIYTPSGWVKKDDVTEEVWYSLLKQYVRPGE
jgi:hypothetical protein